MIFYDESVCIYRTDRITKILDKLLQWLNLHGFNEKQCAFGKLNKNKSLKESTQPAHTFCANTGTWHIHTWISAKWTPTKKKRVKSTKTTQQKSPIHVIWILCLGFRHFCAYTNNAQQQQQQRPRTKRIYDIISKRCRFEWKVLFASLINHHSTVERSGPCWKTNIYIEFIGMS